MQGVNLQLVFRFVQIFTLRILIEQVEVIQLRRKEVLLLVWLFLGCRPRDCGFSDRIVYKLEGALDRRLGASGHVVQGVRGRESEPMVGG